MRRKVRRLAAWLLAIAILAAQAAQPARAMAASVPKPDAKATQKNVMAVLNAYDADGAYILQSQIDKGEDVTWWFNVGPMSSGFVTAVHEECHGYSISFSNFDAERIYLGNKKSVEVEQTDVYPSQKMADSVPKKLRTFRFDSYVGKSAADMSSNVDGAYGLLNEFTAYCWGSNTGMRLYSYYKEQKPDPDLWIGYANDYSNARTAYAEFRYYILHYLYYAKKHHPDVYRGIMRNEEFAKAFNRVDGKYAKVVKAYDRRLKSAARLLREQGYEASYDGSTFVAGSGGGVTIDASCEPLFREMEKAKYQEILKALRG